VAKLSRAVGDDVEATDNLQRILTTEISIETLDLDKWIDRDQLVDSRVQFEAAHIAGVVKHLALQIV